MSPVPSKDRLGEYATKAAHLALRQVASAPEQRVSRALAAEARLSPRAAGDTPRRVAILTPRSWAVHVQWEAMIAQALRLRGADVSFITCGGGLEICDRVNTYEGPPVPCGSCTKYVHDSIDAHGFPRIPLRPGWEQNDPGPWPEIDELPAGELLDVTWDEMALGQMVDIPSKWFLMGATEGDPLAPMTTRRFLRTARRLVRGLDAALDELRPDVVLLCNGLFVFEAVAWELCRRRRIDVVTYERGFIKETLVFRRGAPACLTDVSHLWPAWRDVPLADHERARLTSYLDDRRHGRRTIDRYWRDPTFEQVAERPSGGRLAVLFTNLTWDSAVIGQEVAFPSIQAWLEEAVRAFAERPEHRLVVRIHPAEVKLPGKQTREPLGEHLRAAFATLPPNVTMIDADDPTSSYPLMEAADVGIVFTSTTGLELALHGTPVIVAGRTHYRGKGFTLDASSRESFYELLDKALADPLAVSPDPEIVARYAYLFFFRAPVGSPGVEEHVPGLARITVDSLADLAPGRNDDVDRICAGILDGADFTASG